MFRRSRFADVIRRQLDLFESDHAADLRELSALHDRWNAAEREDAEEAFGEYADAVGWTTETLMSMRDRFAATLDEAEADRFEREFDQAVRRRMPILSRKLDA